MEYGGCRRKSRAANRQSNRLNRLLGDQHGHDPPINVECAYSQSCPLHIYWRSTVTTRSDRNSLLRRLSRAGFKRDFVRPAIFPDWWEDSLESDSSLLPEIELRVARFLGISVADVRNPAQPLAAPSAPNTVLKKTVSVDVDSLRPAIHAARRVAEAVVRNIKTREVTALPQSAEEWRRELVTGRDPVTFEKMLSDLWNRGIPVVPLACLPSPSFQGIATIIEGRPVIVIGQRHDIPGRVGFFVAHEAGHRSRRLQRRRDNR